MSNYSIKDLEKLSGIKAHTIRIWEKRYSIIQPARTVTNIRTYCDDDLKRLLNIAVLRKQGIKISHISNFTDAQMGEKIMHFNNHSLISDGKIEGLVVAMIEFDKARFEKLISDSIITHGFEETLINLVYPFFNQLGLLWQTGSILPAHEHFASNLIRQKIILAIDNQITSQLKQYKTFLLFLPENEFHELNLLFHHYIINTMGHKVVYIGQSLPFSNLKPLVEKTQCEFLFTSITTNVVRKDLRDYIKDLSTSFPEQKIFISGAQVNQISFALPSNVCILKSVEDFKREANKI